MALRYSSSALWATASPAQRKTKVTIAMSVLFMPNLSRKFQES